MQVRAFERYIPLSEMSTNQRDFETQSFAHVSVSQIHSLFKCPDPQSTPSGFAHVSVSQFHSLFQSETDIHPREKPNSGHHNK